MHPEKDLGLERALVKLEPDPGCTESEPAAISATALVGTHSHFDLARIHITQLVQGLADLMRLEG